MQISVPEVFENHEPSAMNFQGSITRICKESCLVDHTSEYSEFPFRRSPRISSCYTPSCPVLWILRCFSFWNCLGTFPLPFSCYLFSRPFSLVSSPVPYHPPPSNYISTTDHSFSINRYFVFTYTFFGTTPLKVGLWNKSSAVNEFSSVFKKNVTELAELRKLRNAVVRRVTYIVRF
jgi:hypothetical protein